MQESKIENIETNKHEDEIINKKNTTTENSSLNSGRNNKNEFSDKKSCFMKHRLLIILSIIIGVILIITSLIITILVTQKKQEKIIVEIKREINQIDYYHSTKKQKIYFENVKSSNDEKLRNLEEEIFENSTEATINFLTSINTYDIKKYFNGTTIYKSFIIIKELSYVNENGNDEKILSFNFDEEINESEENIEEIDNLPLIQVEFYKNGTIINEFVPKNLNKKFLDLLEYSKEKLIPLVSENLYKNDNLRILSDDYDKMTYKKENNVVILKREINSKVNNNGNIIKDSINEGNMETTIINGTIKNIELKSYVSLSTNDTNEENNKNEDNTYFKLPYHKISSDVYENFTFIKSVINKKVTNNLKKLITKCSLIDKNKLNEEEEKKEENNKEKLEDKLRRLSSNSLFKDSYEYLTILSHDFLGSTLRIYLKVETFLNLEKLIVTLYLDYYSNTHVLLRKEHYISSDYAQIKIINNLIGYKKQVKNFSNDFLKLMKDKLIPLYKEVYEERKKFEIGTLPIIILIIQKFDDFEKGNILEEVLISFYEYYKKNYFDKKIKDLESFIDLLNNLLNEINNFSNKIENHFNNKNLSIPNYYNPIAEFNKLNLDFEKNIPNLSSEAVKYFNEKRNLRNLNDLKDLVNDLKNENNENNDNNSLRSLAETPYVSGNPFINSILQDFDRISYEYYLLLHYLKTKYDLEKLTKGDLFRYLTKNYTIVNLKNLKKKEKIEEIILSIITIIKYFKTINEKIDKVKTQLKNIYNEKIPKVKSKTYDSMINSWKSILRNTEAKILLNIDDDIRKKSIFNIGFSFLGFGLRVFGDIDRLISNIKVNITFNPNDLSVSLNLQVQKSLQFSIGGSVDVLLVGGSVKSSVSFGDLYFQLKPTLDFYYLQNKIPYYYYYKVPQLCFYADVYYTVPTIKCKKVWFVPVCYPWVDQIHNVLTDTCTNSKTFSSSYTYSYDIFDRSKINRKSLENKNIMVSNNNWVNNNFN